MNVETNIQSIAVGKNNGLGNYYGGNTTNNNYNNNTNIDLTSLDDFIGATANTQGYRGLVPAPLAGEHDKFLRGDATWAKVFEHITEDAEGNITIDGHNIIIDGSTLNVNSATYFNDVVYALSQFYAQHIHTDEISSYTTDSSIIINSPTEFNAQVFFDYLVKYFGDVIFEGDHVTVNSSFTVNGQSIFNGDSYFNQDIYAKDITVENLTVTKLAHFFSLVIDKIKSVGGSIILSAANCVIDKVIDSSTAQNTKRIYWKATNDMSDTGLELNYERGINNEFADYDQVICQTFNMNEYMEGTTLYNVSNKYYWFRLGENATGAEFTDIDGENVLCNYMDVKTDSSIDGMFLPEKGDNLVQLGNTSDGLRQSAIILSAYKNIDSYIEAPSLAFYRGIKTYELAPYRYSWFASDTTRLRGEDIVFTSGETVQELIDNINSSIIEYDRYVWIKYADVMPESSDTSIYDIPTINTKYIGICNNSNLPIAPADYTAYKWSRFVGTALTGQTTYYRISDQGDDPEHDSDMTPAVWSTTRPSVTAGDYLWTKIVYTYSDGTTSTMYNVSYIADSQVITDISTTYAIVVPDPCTGILPMTTPADNQFTYSTLSSAMSDVELGDLLWSKTVYTYSDNTSTVSYGVNRIGADGSQGEPGDSEYIHLAYANSSDGSLNFNTVYFNGALYIGSYVDTSVLDSSLYTDYEWKRLKGEPGTTVTIVSQTIEYCVSSSGSEPPSGPWVSVMPEVQKGYYLWTRITITYSDTSKIIYYTTTYYPYDGDGTPGANAEYYALVPLVEQAIVDKYGTLGANFQYQIMHISGDVGEIIDPSTNGYHVRGVKTTVMGLDSPINFTIDGTVSKYIDSSLQVNHHQAGNSKIRSFRMMLYDSSLPMENTARCVVPVFDSGATLEITDSIIATVQGNYQSLDGRIGAVENDMAGLGIWKDLIDASVNSNTTLINNLTGQVEANTSAIADLSITPGEIQSLVTRVTELEEGGAYNAGIVNLFGFNDGWTYAYGTPMPKFYGAYANTDGNVSMTMTYNKMAENFDTYDYAFNTYKSDFAVSFELNAAINASTGYVTVNSVQKEIPATAWGDRVTLVYSDVNTQSGLTVQFTGLTSSLIIKNIMITPGNVTGQCQESPADHYYSTNTGELGFNDWDLDIWNIVDSSVSAPVEETDAPTHTIKDNKYPGQTTYLLKSTDNVSTMLSDTIDVSVGPYTMVYMAKSDGQVDITSNFGGGDATNRTFTSTVLDNWLLYVGHCYLNSSGAKTMTLGKVTNWNGSTKLWIAGAKIYKGYLSRSQVIQTFNSGSMIRQTADDIELKVKNTGINIEDGTITLTADNTIISDDLTVKKLITMPNQGDAHIEIYNSEMNIYNMFGTLQIQFGLDEEGNAVLKFFDKNGNLLYNLGPNGLSWIQIIEEEFMSSTFKFISNSPSTSGLAPYPEGQSTTLYQYKAARLNGAIVGGNLSNHDSALAAQAEKKWFKTQAIHQSGTYYTANEVTGLFRNEDIAIVKFNLIQKYEDVAGAKEYLLNEIPGMTSEIVNGFDWTLDTLSGTLKLKYAIYWTWYSRFIDGYQDLVFKTWQEG